MTDADQGGGMDKHRFVPSTSIGEAKRICDECGGKRRDPIHEVDEAKKSPESPG